MQIDGRNYTPPGSYVPGGDPNVVYITRDTLANIQANFPAADHLGFKARATDLNIDVTAVQLPGPVYDWLQDGGATPPSLIKESFSLTVVPGADNVNANPEYSFRMPWDFTIDEVRAYIFDAAFVSEDVVIDVLNNAVSILSSPLTIDYGAAEKTSMTSASPAVISSPSCVTDDEITVEITSVPGQAKGLTITLLGYRA